MIYQPTDRPRPPFGSMFAIWFMADPFYTCQLVLIMTRHAFSFEIWIANHYKLDLEQKFPTLSVSLTCAIQLGIQIYLVNFDGYYCTLV